jgi:hypothetical protein
MPFSVSDPVDVRATDALTWLPGVVASTAAGPFGSFYSVTLNAAVTANAWSGVTRLYGGTNTLTTVFINKHMDQLVPNELIRVQGG